MVNYTIRIFHLFVLRKKKTKISANKEKMTLLIWQYLYHGLAYTYKYILIIFIVLAFFRDTKKYAHLIYSPGIICFQWNLNCVFPEKLTTQKELNFGHNLQSVFANDPIGVAVSLLDIFYLLVISILFFSQSKDYVNLYKINKIVINTNWSLIINVLSTSTLRGT